MNWQIESDPQNPLERMTLGVSIKCGRCGQHEQTEVDPQNFRREIVKKDFYYRHHKTCNCSLKDIGIGFT